MPHSLDVRVFITVIELYFPAFCVSSGRCPEVPANRPARCWESIWCQTPQVCTDEKRTLIIAKYQIHNWDDFISPQGGNSVQFHSMQAVLEHKTTTTMTTSSRREWIYCTHMLSPWTKFYTSLMSINPHFSCHVITKPPCPSDIHTFFKQTDTHTLVLLSL